MITSYINLNWIIGAKDRKLSDGSV